MMFTDVRQVLLPSGTDTVGVISEVGSIWRSWGWHVFERDGFPARTSSATAPMGTGCRSNLLTRPVIHRRSAESHRAFPEAWQAMISRFRSSSHHNEARDCQYTFMAVLAA